MGNFKKFLKNKNTVTILGVIACMVILYAGYAMRINSKTELVEVYIANQTIQPKTLITSDMISKKRVPKSFLLGTFYRNYSDIEGKYSNYNTIIAEGSLFYSELLVEEENLPDAMFYDVNEGEKIVSFPVTTESTYGNSIMPGSKVDIYVKYMDGNNAKNKKVVYGKLFEKIDVLAVKDGAGNNVFENSNNDRTPAYIYFSLEEAKYLLFSSLEEIQEYYSGDYIEIVMVPNTVEYDGDDKLATEVTSDYLYEYILNNIKKIDDQEDLYNELLNEMEQAKLNKENQNTGE